MGIGIVVKCNNCDAEIVFMHGIGALYSSLNVVLDNNILRKQKKAKVRKILREFNPDSVDYEHNLYTCPKCETLHERFYINLSRNNKTLFETEFRCGICRSKLMPANKSISSYRCGECGQHDLERIEDFLWD